MTGRPKCAIEGCNNGALVLWGTKWVCGECYYKATLKKQAEQDKFLEDL